MSPRKDKITKPILLSHPVNRTFWNCLRLSKPWCDLHFDIARVIYDKSSENRKQIRINAEGLPYCSKSIWARKRRGRSLEVCTECGKDLQKHGPRCRTFNTPAQEDVKTFCHIGPIRMVAENCIRPNSAIHYFVSHEMNKIREKKIPRLQNITLKDLDLEGEWNVKLPNLNPNYMSGEESE